MSLELLNWKALPATYPSQSSTVSDLLNDIYSVLTYSTKYLDGSPRTYGVNAAWTWSKEVSGSTTLAIYGVPPNSTLNHRVILAGSPTTRTPVMASPDGFTANIIDVSVAKNAGAFTSYSSSAPFTSGQFFGYWHWCSLNSGLFDDTKLYQIFESKDCFGISVLQSDGTTCTPFIAGAILDPDSTNSLDAETDGKLYGIITGGSSVANTIDFTVFTTTHFTNHSTLSTGRSHAGIFLPNTGSIAATSRVNGALTTNLPYTTRNGKIVREPIHYQLNTSPYSYVGRLREVYISKSSLYGNVLYESGSQTGAFIACSQNVLVNALLLTSGSV